MKGRRFRVMIVDDFAPLRRAISSILAGKDNLQIVGEASEGLEALGKAHTLQPDLILLDIGLPNLNGFEAARQMSAVAPHATILFVSEESSPEVVSEALNLGAGYVHKLHIQNELLPAIETVLRDEQFVSSGVNEDVNRSSIPQTTRRDHEALKYSNKIDLVESFTRSISAITDAAVAIMRSEFASMQTLDFWKGTPGELVLLAFRGFTPEAAQFWQIVSADSDSTCGAALRTGQRVIVPDVETCTFMVGTEDLLIYRQTGIRAVQTTPLLSRNGHLVGMISTHWRTVHMPKESDLRMLDVLVRQAADLIERRPSDED